MRAVRSLAAMVATRWPAWRGSTHDAAREDQRRALALFLAAPEAPGGGPLAGAPGFAGTPGIGDAILGQRLALADPPDHRGAAEAFFRSLRAMPDIDDDATDATRQARLAQALALMLLAHHAVKAGLAARHWGRFGTAAEAAATAVARQPLQIYLRFEQAEVLRLLGRWQDAFATLRDARPLATDLAARFRLADTAGEIAAQASDAAEGGNAGLLDAAEREFLAPLLATGADDGAEPGPAAPPAGETAARDWAWWVAFRAGKVALTRARLAAEGEAEAAAAATRAARRFARALVLMDQAATPVRGEHRANLAEWRRQALAEAAARHLAAGGARAAADALSTLGSGGHGAMADAIAAWLAAGRPARFAAAALPGHGAEATALALPALATASRSRRDEATHALPPLAEPVVVEVTDPLLMDEELANAIIGGDEEPTIAGLRERLRSRFRFRLPGVRLRGVDDASAPRRVTVLFVGTPALTVTAPGGTVLALATPDEARRAGLVAVADAPAVDGVGCAWVATPAASATVALRDPAYGIVGALETAVLRALPRLIGLDDAAAIIPGLDDAMLPRALAALRLLAADRTGIDDAVVEHMRAGLAAGDDAETIVRHLRLLPGMRALLWGNEGGKRPVRLAEIPAAAGLGEAVARAIGDARDVALIAPSGGDRAALRAALAHLPAPFAWLADIPVLAESEWSGRA
jgi:hypothetical protein